MLRTSCRLVADIANVVHRKGSAVALTCAEAPQHVAFWANSAPALVVGGLLVPRLLSLLRHALPGLLPLPEVAGDQGPGHRPAGCLSGARSPLFEAPAQLEAAVPADRHPRGDVPDPRVARGRCRQLALRHGTSGLRYLHHVELHVLLVVRDCHVVGIGGLHGREHASRRALRVLGEGDRKAAEAADKQRTVLFHEVPEVALPPGLEVGGDLLHHRHKVLQNTGRLGLGAPEHKEVDDLRVVDVRGDVLGPTGGIPVPAAGRKHVGRRVHKLHRAPAALQASDEIAVP
mmetsp:Transcript_38498/g.119678  ORF Transcript_38498/g.119678 Transcript_38498/m.119678 type:complete len:288 (-) Transcript_38498:221-1084(-)